jgi:hypothetical protein
VLLLLSLLLLSLLLLQVSGASKWCLLDHAGRKVSERKKDLDDLLDHLNIDATNPLAVMTQVWRCWHQQRVEHIHPPQVCNVILASSIFWLLSLIPHQICLCVDCLLLIIAACCWQDTSPSFVCGAAGCITDISVADCYVLVELLLLIPFLLLPAGHEPQLPVWCRGRQEEVRAVHAGHHVGADAGQPAPGAGLRGPDEGRGKRHCRRPQVRLVGQLLWADRGRVWVV